MGTQKWYPCGCVGHWRIVDHRTAKSKDELIIWTYRFNRAYPQCTLFTCSVPGEVGMPSRHVYSSNLFQLHMASQKNVTDFGNIDDGMHVSCNNILIVYVAERAWKVCTFSTYIARLCVGLIFHTKQLYVRSSSVHALSSRILGSVTYTSAVLLLEFGGFCLLGRLTVVVQRWLGDILTLRLRTLRFTLFPHGK